MQREKGGHNNPNPSQAQNLDQPKSPLDLWRLMGSGGKSKRVEEGAKDSLLAVFKDRLTYTFIMGREVASIHFDRSRREIFFKGHNIRNLKLEAGQIEVLYSLKEVLRQDKRGEPFLTEYEATLRRILAENK